MSNDQKFMVCNYCKNFSAISEKIPTCEHCTSVIVNATLKIVNVPDPNNTVKCSECQKSLYIHQTYLCECKLNRYCYSCNIGSAWCHNCKVVRNSSLYKTIWSTTVTRGKS